MLDKKIVLTKKYCEDEINNFARQIGVSSLLIDILFKRGISDIDAIKTFLYGSEEPFHDPFLLKDMKQAVERILKAIAYKEKITEYGDYDVDGITACSLLYLFLKSVGASVSAYIPVRKNEGYGLNLEAIEAIYNSGTRLIITVDCGISGVAEVAAMPSDMDIIITDHHTPPEVLPAALKTWLELAWLLNSARHYTKKSIMMLLFGQKCWNLLLWAQLPTLCH